ncbi:MAG: hypothetical protein ACSLE0_23930 [Chitinophagaceae bacterium]
MKKNELLALAAILLIVLAAVMIYLGISAGNLPPTLTGAGFIIIAFVFLSLRSKW